MNKFEYYIIELLLMVFISPLTLLLFIFLTGNHFTNFELILISFYGSVGSWVLILLGFDYFTSKSLTNLQANKGIPISCSAIVLSIIISYLIIVSIG